MTQEILDEVAFLFVEQFDNLYGMLVDRRDVKRIRQAADNGEDSLYSVAVSIFGEKLDEVLVSAACYAMDYIAYVDETWLPKDVVDKERTISMEELHLKSLDLILHMAQKNERCVANEIKRIREEASAHFQRLKEREIAFSNEK